MREISYIWVTLLILFACYWIRLEIGREIAYRKMKRQHEAMVKRIEERLKAKRDQNGN